MTDSLYLVHVYNIVNHETDGGALYTAEDEAEAAKDWFDEQEHTGASIHELSPNAEFEPPEDFHDEPFSLSWGY